MIIRPSSKFRTLTATAATIGSLAGGAHAAVTITSEDFTSTGVIIVDASTFLHQFSVTAPAGETITDVSITVSLSASGSSIASDGTIPVGADNPFLNELSLELTSPLGTVFQLVGTGTYDTGGSGSELVTLTFADGGGIQSGSDLSPGTFAATGGSFSVFDGESASGLWGIRISDSAGADPKSLNSYSLSVTTVPEPSSVLLGGLALLGLLRRRR